ncbi:MAG: TetR/AcrR family transcriptional regulator [Myxococcales bacterium]|nr:TetR/AcrR family transcriptional regulator [Myxococcales bacterium]MDD9967678.1 TetR/AcrR family transcriptional regulator [Myxococcales bacterium]
MTKSVTKKSVTKKSVTKKSATRSKAIEPPGRATRIRKGKSATRTASPSRSAQGQRSEQEGDTTGPRSSRGARTRERLVEAAKEIFEEHGFLDARISDISKRAGQSHGSFYYYFDSKTEIFREVAAAVDEQLFAPLDDVILAQTQLEPEERVREAMRRHFKSYRREARIMGLIEHVSHYDEEINALRLSRLKANTERVAATIRQLQKRKLADPKLDPTLTAAALGALTHRFADMWLVQGAIDCTLEQAIEQLSRVFINAMRLNTPGR